VGAPHDLAIEVKYLRSHPSGSQPARPVHYGQLLADFNKVAQVPGRLRLIVLAADDGYVRYVEQSGRSVLPLKAGQTALITPLCSAGSLTRHGKGRIPRPMARSPHRAPLDQHDTRLLPVRLGSDPRTRAATDGY
jgi:hypothetical protein